MVLRFLTSGESHGKCLNAIIEGIPANFSLDFDFINSELQKRQQGAGRGGRMKIENDKIIFNSGVRFNKTLGTPICIEIKNNDWKNWQEIMSVEKIDKKIPKIQLPRPGHADFAGCVKYNQDDIRNILERSSARETATRVAVGAICQDILKNFKIKGSSKILNIGGVSGDNIAKKIEEAKQNGDTLGGEFEITFKNLPVGLGSFAHYDRRLDGLIAQAVMSIPAIKSVEIGAGKVCSMLTGSKFHDEIFYENDKISRKTNNAGGIEGGMTNGETLVVRASMKPIPSLKIPLNSINLKSKKPDKAHFERSDVCAVEACAVVALNMVAIVILSAFLEKFGGDSFEEIKRNYAK